MAVVPSARFPLSEKDQAEVIGLFNELKGRPEKSADPSRKAPKRRLLRPPSSLTDLGSEWGLPGTP
jgi:hypothetical protein